ncbi:MAG: hypothetical protein KC417_02100, partial [Myxococcales bacterium]|nr:hypothetical protein [Myxococcales bacterium]
GLYRPGSFGGTVIADLGARFGVFSLGGGLGAAALSSDDAERSRAFMPLALSAGVALGETWRVRFRARGGLWAGAVNEGLRAGPFASAGAYLDVPLGPDAWFTVGTDGWLMAGGDTILLFAPGIGLAWNFGGSGL